MNIELIFKHNREWAGRHIADDPQFFDKLSKGQNPSMLYIGCSDSRVTAEEILGAAPGEVFVHRNIANMVSNNDLNAMSVIEYAVSYLEVEHIVVCGHYYCAGIAAAMAPRDMGVLDPWLRNIRDVYRLHRKELEAIPDEESRYKRLVELNVQEQCVNIIKTASVQKAYKNNKLTVHGWVFDMKSGRLIDIGIDFEKVLADIMAIYKII